jgi:ribosomal silencing factor RsfS
MTSLTSYVTVNSGSRMTVSMASVSHVIEHVSPQTQNNNSETSNESCWVHFDSGKSVHVQESFENVNYDFEEYHKTHH